MRFILALRFVLSLIALAPAAPSVLAEGETRIGKTFHCGPEYRNPTFTNVDDFVADVRSRKAPWGELLMPDGYPDYEKIEDFAQPLSGAWNAIQVIHRSRNAALVFARNKPNRGAPYCTVVFLLAKRGGQFRVADFIRLANWFESYGDVSEPKILKLRPRDCVHFYFTKFDGGRKMEFDTDEFYMVRHNRFHQTLLLKNDAAYVSPAGTFREFDQSREVSVITGRPFVSAVRSWTADTTGEAKQNISVLFRWNSRRQKFTNASRGKLTVKEPGEGSEGLPQPPRSQP